MENVDARLDVRDFVALRPIVEEARSRGETHIKLACGKYPIDGDLRYLDGVIVECFLWHLSRTLVEPRTTPALKHVVADQCVEIEIRRHHCIAVATQIIGRSKS